MYQCLHHFQPPCSTNDFTNVLRKYKSGLFRHEKAPYQMLSLPSKYVLPYKCIPLQHTETFQGIVVFKKKKRQNPTKLFPRMPHCIILATSKANNPTFTTSATFSKQGL